MNKNLWEKVSNNIYLLPGSGGFHVGHVESCTLKACKYCIYRGVENVIAIDICTNRRLGEHMHNHSITSVSLCYLSCKI